MFNPTFLVVTQMLGQNNPIAGFVHILPNAGLYLTQHFLECNLLSSLVCLSVKKGRFGIMIGQISCQSNSHVKA